MRALREVQGGPIVGKVGQGRRVRGKFGFFSKLPFRRDRTELFT